MGSNLHGVNVFFDLLCVALALRSVQLCDECKV